MQSAAYKINVFGIVQGVGFRPFIYHLAKRLSLKGYVTNTLKGVMIYVEGDKDKIKELIVLIEKEKPEVSDIERIDVSETELLGMEKFAIIKSTNQGSNEIYITTDFSTCNECKKDIFDIHNKRYGYPFTTCTYCGPRYSIITGIPYDRANTIMDEFEMCTECRREYENPLDRRYHSQPNACAVCGPQLTLYNSVQNRIENTNTPINDTIQFLKEGFIVSIKGLGGYLLCCDAQNNQSVKLLRKRKQREAKPFAIMCKNLETARIYCDISIDEQKLLQNPRNPIVLLKKKNNSNIADEISIDNNYLGIMLPYTPIHLLLMDKIDVLVMTSANISDMPIIKDDQEAIKELSKIADYILLHNRKISNRIDDSVYKIINHRPQAIRRGRGYVPGVLEVKGLNKPILAVGGELKNTFCVNRKETVLVGPHIGDLKSVETSEFFKNSINKFLKIFDITPEIVACDMHPQYISTIWAKENFPKTNIVQVQHHHAHLVSTLVENGREGAAIGIVMDGAGLGTDGAIWGCECGIVSTSEFDRRGHLSYFPLPGGDKCTHEVFRCGISLLSGAIGDKELKKCSFLNSIPEDNIDILLKMMTKHVNTFDTSSMGRLFDGVSSILGLVNFSKYEANAAIILESIADSSIDEKYKVNIVKIGGMYEWDWRGMIADIVTDMSKNVSIPVISAKFHNTVVNYIITMAEILHEETGIKDVALSGGVFLNSWISAKAEQSLYNKGYNVYLQRIFSPGDGGICIGQLKIASEVSALCV